MKLSKSPTQRYLYAALVARGTPSTEKAGLRPSYQIAIALSLRPPRARQRYALQSYNPRVRKRKDGGILLDVIAKNRGNMVAPPTGTYTIKGAAVTRTMQQVAGADGGRASAKRSFRIAKGGRVTR